MFVARSDRKLSTQQLEQAVVDGRLPPGTAADKAGVNKVPAI